MPTLLTRLSYYASKHKWLLAILGFVGGGAICVGVYLASPNTVPQGLWISFGTGVLSSLVIACVTDFMSKEFFYDVLRNFQASIHEGGLVHSSHRDIPSRQEAVRRFLAKGDAAKIITLTADK